MYLKNPAFNANEVVDTDMLLHLPESFDSSEIQIINVNVGPLLVEGDGKQVLELFRRPAEKVLRERMADMRLAGCQPFVFHKYKDPRGQQAFFRALQWFSIFSISPSNGW